MVVRKTNRYIIVQLIVPESEGDRTLVVANSKELAAFGYTFGSSNTPAAYLTGMLCAMRARAAGYERAVLDIGLAQAKPGARVFAALKGAVDAGLDVPYGEEILPDDARINGEHIAAFMPDVAAGISANVKQVAEAIKKEKV
jgi:large subunit ribosomal protein L18